MRCLLFLAAVIAVSPAIAADESAVKQAHGSTDFQSLKAAFDKAQATFHENRLKAIEKAKATNTPLVIRFDETPMAKFAPRYLDFIEEHPNDPSAFEALQRASHGSAASPENQVRVVKIARDKYLKDPRIKDLINDLVYFRNDQAEALVYAVVEQHPDRETRAQGLRVLMRRTETDTSTAKSLKLHAAEMRKGMEPQLGNAAIEWMISHGERGEEDLARLRQQARDQFPDLLPDLSVGQPAPELVSRDLEDREVKLSDYRGKVVVLDMWATWCGPCRGMIPHEREMIERLKDKPFALISVSVDDEKETLQKFLETEKMPWTHWWNGAHGKLIDTLNLNHYPTIYVIDQKGIIRFKELRDQALEDAVNSLLKEQESGKAE